MKLSQYAKSIGVSYQTAWKMWKRDELNAYQLSSGTVIVETTTIKPSGVAIYARVSSTENKSNLDSQALRLTQYCEAKGYQIVSITKEIGSGINDNRKKLINLLKEDNYSLIVVEHKDRLTRIGFNYLQVLLEKQGKSIEVVNLATEETENIIRELKDETS